MNNSLVTLEEDKKDNKVFLRSRENELVKIIEALNEILEGEGWSTLKTSVLEKAADELAKKLNSESMKPELDLPTIYRIQGQMAFAKRYSLENLAESFKLELIGVRKQLNPPTERALGS